MKGSKPAKGSNRVVQSKEGFRKSEACIDRKELCRGKRNSGRRWQGSIVRSRVRDVPACARGFEKIHGDYSALYILAPWRLLSYKSHLVPIHTRHSQFFNNSALHAVVTMYFTL